jgi:branched-chain amino acid transport system ATP-binding protein
MTGAPILAVTDLSAAYGLARVLFGVTFDVPRGETVALMGRNGAGKTTTLKTIMGLLPATGGEVRFRDEEIAGRRPFEIARLGLVFTPEELFEIFPNLAAMRARRASAMSGGEQQMLTIARTLMGNPVAVLLDEPSEGLAPVIVDQMIDAMLRLKKTGMSILLSEQNLAFAEPVADRAVILEKGAIRFAGLMSDLRSDSAEALSHLTV